jgi:hypothetical protein
LRFSATQRLDEKVEPFTNSLIQSREKSVAIASEGFDLTKNAIAVRSVEASGKTALVRPCVLRPEPLEFIAPLPLRLFGMDACSDSHF